VIRARGGTRIAKEFSTEELKEFLEGDLQPTQADPAFQERLRQELWALVQERYGRSPDDPRPGEGSTIARP
jgi:hypothetical protein